MAKFTLANAVTNKWVFDVLQNNLRHERIQSINLDKNGNVEVNTTWMKYSVSTQGNQLSINAGWNKAKKPLIIGLAITGLILIVPLIVVAIISIGQAGEQKLIPALIFATLSAHR